MNQYLAVTSNGLENLLVEELTQLGINDAKPVQAGVKFKATNEQIYRCCLWSRLASRFVRIVAEFKCQNDLDLYLSTTSVNWVNYFHSSKKLVVDFNGTNREIRNSQYGAMKVKDAIVDCFTKKKSSASVDQQRSCGSSYPCPLTQRECSAWYRYGGFRLACSGLPN